MSIKEDMYQELIDIADSLHYMDGELILVNKTREEGRLTSVLPLPDCVMKSVKAHLNRQLNDRMKHLELELKESN